MSLEKSFSYTAQLFLASFHSLEHVYNGLFFYFF